MKEQIIELVNLYTAVELAEMIRAKDREIEYKQEEIEKLKVSLKYYRDSTNQAAELINLATEKKHGDMRTQKFIKSTEIKASNCFEFACVYSSRGGCRIQGYMSDEGELNGTKEHCKHYDAMCVSAKCSRCARENQETVCPKFVKE